MDIRLSIADEEPGGQHITSIQDWLRLEDDLRGKVVAQRAPIARHEMGAAVDALGIALGGGGALSVLAASLRVWFAQPRRSDVIVRIKTASGATVEIDAKRVANAEALIAAALAARPDPE